MKSLVSLQCHFSGLNFIRQAFDWWWKTFWMVLQFRVLLISLKSLIPSPDIFRYGWSSSAKLITLIINNSGLRTQPYGTPLVTSAQSEKASVPSPFDSHWSEEISFYAWLEVQFCLTSLMWVMELYVFLQFRNTQLTDLSIFPRLMITLSNLPFS